MAQNSASGMDSRGFQSTLLIPWLGATVSERYRLEVKRTKRKNPCPPLDPKVKLARKMAAFARFTEEEEEAMRLQFKRRKASVYDFDAYFSAKELGHGNEPALLPLLPLTPTPTVCF